MRPNSACYDGTVGFLIGDEVVEMFDDDDDDDGDYVVVNEEDAAVDEEMDQDMDEGKQKKKSRSKKKGDEQRMCWTSLNGSSEVLNLSPY